MAEDRIKLLTQHLGVSPNAASTAGLFVHTPYDYTLDKHSMRRLTQRQREQYERDGFLVIRKLVAPEKLEKFRERFQKICNGEVDRGYMTVMRDVAIAKSEYQPGEQAITKIQNWEDDQVMFEYCRIPEILHYVQCFLGDNVMSTHTMLINKPPDPGTKTSRHPMHQDLHYFPFRPANRIVCSWTAMQDINRQNGCLVVIPGSHTNPGRLLEHGYPQWEGGVNKAYHGIVGYEPENDKREHLAMGPGDTVFFHPLLIHGSGMNKSDGFRKSISCHYAASECNYIDVGNSTQSAIEKEVKEILAKKMKVSLDEVQDIHLKDIWKAKVRLVLGNEVNM